MTTEQQSREAFDLWMIGNKHPLLGEFAGPRWEGWQAALKWRGGQEGYTFAEEAAITELQQIKGMSRQAVLRQALRVYQLQAKSDPLADFQKVETPAPHPAVEEAKREFNELADAIHAADTRHPAVSFTDGKLNPPPFGQWHREDWEPEMLAGGWRPLMLDEYQQEGDEFLSGPRHWAVARTGFPQVCQCCEHVHSRTRRPLPPAPEPQPPEGYHIATEEERKCLPVGSLFWWENVWVEAERRGRPAVTDSYYACPDAPAEEWVPLGPEATDGGREYLRKLREKNILPPKNPL